MNKEQIEQVANNYIGHPYEVDEGVDVFSRRAKRRICNIQ